MNFHYERILTPYPINFKTPRSLLILLNLIVLWKYLELVSPSCTHCTQDFCLTIANSFSSILFSSINNIIHLFLSSSSRGPSSSLLSMSPVSLTSSCLLTFVLLKTSKFHFLSPVFSTLNFSFMSFSLFLSPFEVSQVFLTTSLKPSTYCHKSNVLNGLGPKSIVLFLTITAQWSNTCLFRIYWLESCQCCNHASDTRISLLLANPLGQYQVYFVPTTGMSNNSHLSINSLDLVVSIFCDKFLVIPLLSCSLLTNLKSPNTHQTGQLWFDLFFLFWSIG